jgi:nuclear transport factor 2 (NTF2) superfamily protein
MHGIHVILRRFHLGIPKRAYGEIAPNFSRGAQFLTRKWNRELDYRLIKELWSFTDNRIAVRFAYEWHDDAGNWFRSYGNENWEFNDAGFMVRRYASINDFPIKQSDRKYHWDASGPRPADHPSLSDLGF